MSSEEKLADLSKSNVDQMDKSEPEEDAEQDINKNMNTSDKINSDIDSNQSVENKNTNINDDDVKSVYKGQDSIPINKILNTAIESVKSMDEGSDSQEEELLLRWDDDDDDENEAIKCDQTIIDEDALLTTMDDNDNENHDATKLNRSIQSIERTDNIVPIDTLGTKAIKPVSEIVEQSVLDIRSKLNKSYDQMETEDVLKFEKFVSLVGCGVVCTNVTLDKELAEVSGCGSMAKDVTELAGDNVILSPSLKSPEEVHLVESDDLKRQEINAAIADINSELIETNENMEVDEYYSKIEEPQVDANVKSNAKVASATIYCTSSNNDNYDPQAQNKQVIETLKRIDTVNPGIPSPSIETVVPKFVGAGCINVNYTLGSENKTTHDLPKNNDGKPLLINTDTVTNNVNESVGTSLDSQNLDISITPGIKIDHGINEPDVMLEIPTQELIDIDENDLSLDQDISLDIENQLLSKEDEDLHLDSTSQISQNPTENLSVDKISQLLDVDITLESQKSDNLINKTAEVDKVPNKSSEIQEVSGSNSDIAGNQPAGEGDISNKTFKDASEDGEKSDKNCKYYYYYKDTDAQPTELDSPKIQPKDAELLNNSPDVHPTDVSNIEDENIPCQTFSPNQQDTRDYIDTDIKDTILAKEVDEKSQTEVSKEDKSRSHEINDQKSKVHQNDINDTEAMSEFKATCIDNENVMADMTTNTIETKTDVKIIDSQHLSLPVTPAVRTDHDLSVSDVSLEMSTIDLMINKIAKKPDKVVLTEHSMNTVSTTEVMNLVEDLPTITKNSEDCVTPKTQQLEIKPVSEKISYSKETLEYTEANSSNSTKTTDITLKAPNLPVDSTITADKEYLRPKSELQAHTSAVNITALPSSSDSVLQKNDSILSPRVDPKDKQATTTSEIILPVSENLSNNFKDLPTTSKPVQATTDCMPASDLLTSASEAIPSSSDTMTKNYTNILNPSADSKDTQANIISEMICPSISENISNNSIVLPSTSKCVQPVSDLKPKSELVTSAADITTSVISSSSDPVPEKDDNILPPHADLKDKQESITSETISENFSSISKAVASTSKSIHAVSDCMPLEAIPSTSSCVPSTSRAKQSLYEDLPSTSSGIQRSPARDTDMSDQTLEVQDSLGLLAESSRTMEYDEENDDEDCEDEEDIDIDDESSNQMTAEHSEDSNAPHPEKDSTPGTATSEKDIDKGNVATAEEEKEHISAVEEVTDKENIENDDTADMDCDDIDITEDISIENASEQIEDLINESETDYKDENRTVSKRKPVSMTEEQQIQAKVGPRSETTEDKKMSQSNESLNTDEVPAKKKKMDNMEKVVEGHSSELSKQSPSKTKNFIISKPSNVFNIVELEESSSEDDVQELPKEAIAAVQQESSLGKDVMISVNVAHIEEMKRSDIKSEIPVENIDTTPTLEKPVTDKISESTVLPVKDESQEKSNESIPKLSLEIFNLDSDDEDSKQECNPQEQTKEETSTKSRKFNRCINEMCRSDTDVYYKADTSIVAHFDGSRKKKPMVCDKCVEEFTVSRQKLIEGVKNMTPLLELDMRKLSEDCVEISDSDSEEEVGSFEEEKELVGDIGALLLEENLADLMNETWKKFKMDVRLKETTDLLNEELDKLNEAGEDIDRVLNECLVATDNLRNDLYATFEPNRKLLPAIVIIDTPNKHYTCYESFLTDEDDTEKTQELPKRRTRKSTMPLGYVPLNSDAQKTQDNAQDQTGSSKSGNADPSRAEEDKDVSVVQLSAEVAPPDLPPCGDVTRPPLKIGLTVYAVRNSFGAWLKAKILELTPRGTKGLQYTMCRVKFETTTKSLFKVLSARNLAYEHPSDMRLTIGTRVIALFKDAANDGKRESFYSGIVAEVPNPVNSYRYLVFFDDGYAQYVLHKDTRIVCETSPVVWDEVHPFSREFVRKYLLAYPERPMVRLHAGQSLKTEWNGKWWASKVIKVDASLVQVHFEEDNRTEWIYRGSTRLAPLYLELQAAERHRNRPLPRSKAQPRSNMPYVEYTRSDEQNTNKEADIQAQKQEEIRRQRAVAKKSTSTAQAHAQQPPSSIDSSLTTRVVYYTPKNAVKPFKMVSHTCNTKCRRTDVLGLKELRTYNPLAKPLLSGWERQTVRYKGQKEVMYRAPCGRRLRNMQELHAYLRAIHSEMAVDLFDFHPNTHCLAEFVVTKCLVGKKDLSHGKENVPVPCVNTLDDTLPEFCSYNTERTPTAGVPLNLDPEFLCGCDCTDDCEDKSKCACWQLTLEGAKTIGHKGSNIGYVYRRLPDPLPSGIYECNSRCKCKNTCLNRVAQHPLQLKLQVFKTLNRGWGIRALNDVPAGAFLCVYAGNLLTDATANLDGLNEGDEYLAELDYIEVVEQMKEDYEDDIPEEDKKLDKKELNEPTSEEEAVTSEEEDTSQDDKQDGDFTPGHTHWTYKDIENKKTLRKRERKAKKEEEKILKEASQCDVCVISDDEEVREPSRFTAEPGMGAKEFVSKYKSVRAHFGKDEACYIMDAKVQGNIGRYLNHSCQPNVFVQNVFVDTHDPRFPWVAFFASSHIRAGTELTWNYNYDVGSVPGKVLYCHCGTPVCRKRLL